ncbi:hypothetical protein Droror1_Dr00019817 [Drosera rotundifolia]
MIFGNNCLCPASPESGLMRCSTIASGTSLSIDTPTVCSSCGIVAPPSSLHSQNPINCEIKVNLNPKLEPPALHEKLQHQQNDTTKPKSTLHLCKQTKCSKQLPYVFPIISNRTSCAVVISCQGTPNRMDNQTQATSPSFPELQAHSPAMISNAFG